MRKVGIILISLVIGFVLGSGAWGAFTSLGKFTGNDYLEYSQEAKQVVGTSYMAGVISAFYLVTAGADPHLFLRHAQGMTTNQVRAITEKYMADHPEYRHYSMAAIIYAAITHKYPPLTP